jgi:hypothetical protein
LHNEPDSNIIFLSELMGFYFGTSFGASVSERLPRKAFLALCPTCLVVGLSILGFPENYPEQTVSARQSRAAWARLLAKVYEVDALRCNRCGSPMKVLALITDPHQCRRIFLHLIKTGAAPPGLDASTLS